MLIEPADPGRLAELADVAARTFPLACPPAVGPADVAAFITENLSAARFAEYLADPDRTVLTAAVDDRIIGYAMTIRGVPDDLSAAVTGRPAVELSKIYVLADNHGGGFAAALMAAVLDLATAQGAACVWLGVNQKNVRAQRFYIKNGFSVTGTKSFRLGDHIEADYVMVRPA